MSFRCRAQNAKHIFSKLHLQQSRKWFLHSQKAATKSNQVHACSAECTWESVSENAVPGCVYARGARPQIVLDWGSCAGIMAFSLLYSSFAYTLPIIVIAQEKLWNRWTEWGRHRASKYFWNRAPLQNWAQSFNTEWSIIVMMIASDDAMTNLNSLYDLNGYICDNCIIFVA